MRFSKDKELEIFKMAKNNRFKDIGKELGLDEHYENAEKMMQATAYRYKKVKNNPDKYDIDPKEYAEIVQEVSGRKVAERKTPRSAENKDIVEDDPRDVLELLSDLEKGGMVMAEKKLERIMRSKKQLDNTSLTQFSTFIGTIIDKKQLLSGKATENIAMKAKIKEDMDADEALDAMMRQREQIMEGKDRTNRG